MLMGRVIVDTHVLLWAIYQRRRLPRDVTAMLEDRGNEILFSAVSIWEIAIKQALRKPGFSVDPKSAISAALGMEFVELPMRAAAAALVSTLPLIHKDPFDRLLVAQAISEPAVLLSADRILERYSELVRSFTPG
jgi:PIN domain nuclease of toxin-antitoxin system